MSARLRQLVGCWALLLAGLLLADSAWAVTYTFNVGTINSQNPAVSGTPSICSGTWARSGNNGAYVFTCSGDISTAAGDVLTISANSSITVVAGNSTLSLNSTTVGTATRTITLQTSSGTLTTTGTNTIYGSVVSASGAISLAGTTITGSVTGTGAASLTGGSVAGSVNVSGNVTTNGTAITGTLTSNYGVLNLTGGSVGGNVSTGGAVITNGTTIGGTLTSGGTISLTGGSVTGQVRSTCCTVTTNGTNLAGGARSDSSSISITGGTIAGPFYANNNSATFTGVTMTSGTISGASTVTITNSTIGSAESKVTVTSQSGPVDLNNSTVYGDLTAPNYSTINVNSPSTVTGTCLPNSTPANACNANVTPVCFTDTYNRTNLGTDDWAVTSRNGSFGVPKIINNRLRLTDNTGNVATAATLQRLLPAKSNYVQVQFKYYAYNGNGADGVAVIFSDATQTPQPGGYGGSLGYAQLNGVSGFAGGWLGVALDEYGNFSNPTETRIGGPGLRQDSVSIRGSGSGTADYRYLAGTSANLSPSLDVSGATAGPGHTYRITLDSTVVGKTMVRVERNTGSGFTTLISSFDALTGTNQAALPNDFYLSLTGSTGGSNNIHELDDLQVCASKINPVGAQIDHFEFVYTGSALTCNPQPVTIRACLNSNCSSLYTDPVSVTLTPAGYWSAVAPATASGSTISFSGGTAQARLSIPTAGTVSIGVSPSVPSVPPARPQSTSVCSTSNCQITYADSGLLLQVPNTIAAKLTDATIKAVRKSDSALECKPGFVGSRTISFTSGYDNPASGTQPVVLNGSDVRSTPVSLNLTFDSTGTAPLTVRYDDAGRMKLVATYAGSVATNDVGLAFTTDDLFVSKPYGLCLQTDSACSSADANCTVFPGGIRAGDSFPLRIRAVGWQADGEALTAAQLCSGNITTPNFQHAGIVLSSSVQAPTGGANGTMLPASYAHVLGNQTTATTSVSEVGVFTLTATPPASGYLDSETVSGGTSALVGRFIPAYLSAAGSASLTPSCGSSTSAFSYQGQPMGFASGKQPSLTITARNRAGAATTNYDRSYAGQGDFWKLAAPSVGSYSSKTGVTARDARLATQGTAVLSTAGAGNGDGSRIYSWSGQQLLYQAAALPSNVDYPFKAKVAQSFLAASLRETDQGQAVCYGTGAGCLDYSYDFSDDPGSDVRLGRLRIGNARGSELQSLALPVSLESWQNIAGGSFQAEVLDTCTTSAVLGVPVLDGYTGNLAVGETTPASTAPSVGVGSLVLSAPGSGNDGSVQARYSLMPSWLYFAWDGITRSEARGLASFGIYRGATPLIYRREVYR